MYKKTIHPIQKQSSLKSKVEKSIWLQEIKEEELELIKGGHLLLQNDDSTCAVGYSRWW